MKTRISIALFAVLLTGGAAAEAKTVDRPNIIFVLYDDLDATRGGNLAGVQAELDKGVDVNAKDNAGQTPLDWAESGKLTETADLLRKHGGKMGEELKAEGK